MHRIEDWRGLFHVSQSKLAEKVGVSLGTIIRWEKMPETIPVGKLQKIAEILGINITDINFSPKNPT